MSSSAPLPEQIEAENERLSAELERRVVERTGALSTANKELRKQIVERERAEDDLRRQKEVLQKIFDHIPVMISFFDKDGRIKLVNREWERTLGQTVEQIENEGRDIVADSYPDPHEQQRARDFIAAAQGEWSDFSTRVNGGAMLDISWFGVKLLDGTSITIGQDITERKRAQELLQNLSQRLIETQEAERRRLARELHDELGQMLTAIKLNLQALQNPAGSSPQLEESIGIVDSAIQQVRALSLDLRPAQLDDLGLVSALRWHLDREARRAGLSTEFVADLPDARLAPELETACFRIAQEALTNVVRHARARRVWVELKQLDAELRLAIRDDGIGFNVSAVQTPQVSDQNLGLHGMQERALIVGGRMEVKSSPGGGTEVEARFPLT